MTKVKPRKLTRRILSIVLSSALVAGLMPGNVLTVSADESNSTEPSVTNFATPEQLMSSDNFALHSDYTGVAQKVYFGTNGENQQTWYIAGSDADNSIVLLCDPVLPMATSQVFNSSISNGTYNDVEVYGNHYGASDMRKLLQSYTADGTNDRFSNAEKQLMQSTKVYTDDDKLKDDGNQEYTYYTEDKLYAAYGDTNDYSYITIGTNSAESLNDGIKVSLKSAPYDSGDKFWLRAPYSSCSSALNAWPGRYVGANSANTLYSVVPAFRLNLSSVLFASAAPAATSDASLTDTMTFRVDGVEKLKSGATYTTCAVTVNYDEGDGNVFLYVQDADSVYSVEIIEDTTLLLTSMTGIDSLTDESTKIWLEKSEYNVAYTVMAEAVLTEHIPNADDGDCTTPITCSICGTVITEAKEKHIDNDSDGFCDACECYVAPEPVDGYYQIANANNLMWFARQVNAGQTAINAKLTADIDMKDIDWTIMSSFAGTFDGDGHTISYLCADENGGDDDIADGSRCGLFQTLSEGGTVTNLTISGAQLWSAHSAGAIAAVNNGTISKCIVKDSTIELGASHGLAAIAGTNTGTVTDCGVVNCFLQRRYSAANSNTFAIGVVVEDNSGTVSNCFSYGCTFKNSPNLYAIVESGNAPVNCYYYTGATVSDTVATAKTAEAFASGEVAYLMNGSSSENVTWYQKLLTDTYPVLDSKHGIVYSVFKCDGETPAGYSNENKNEPHIDENGDEYCDDCGVIYNGIGAHLAGYSVSLNGSIGVNFHMDLTQDVLDDNEAYMLFSLPNGTTQKVMVSDAKAKESTVIEGKTYYIFTCNVAAKEMTDTIQAQLITSDGSKTQVYKYSVREYAEKILSGSYDAETQELVKAMLHYGAYSQEWFDYNTTNLANAGLDPLDLSDANDWDGFDPIITNDENVGSFTSAYLTLESDTAINLKFKLADGVSFEDLRVVVEDPLGNVVPVTTDTTGNVCLITLTGIKASDLDTTYYFCVTDEEGNKSAILYSAMSYACAVANSEMDQKLKNVTAALRIFNLRADDKFED